MSSTGHADAVSSMEDIIEEEVIATGNGSGSFATPGGATGTAEPLSLVMERSPPPPTDPEPKLEPLRASYSYDDENYYLEPRPPRNADSAPPSFGGTTWP